MIRVLDAGVDTLYWSADPEVGDWFGDAMAAKAVAVVARSSTLWREVRGYSFEVLPHGMGKYAFVARAAEMDVRLTDAEHIPSVYVQLRAGFIHSVGAEVAAAESLAVVREVIGMGRLEAKPSRLDVFADFAGLELGDDDRAGFHTRSEVNAYFTPCQRVLHSIRAGAGSLKLRVYDKRRELTKRGKPMPASWGDCSDVVMRVEAQAGERVLRRFRINTLADACSSYGDVWRYATGRFFVLRVPGEGLMRTWLVDERWQAVQGAALRFPANGLLPFDEAKGDKIRLLRGIRGGLVSLGAHRGEDDIEKVIAALPRELAAVSAGRSFADDVKRRWRRFPRAVRDRSRR